MNWRLIVKRDAKDAGVYHYDTWKEMLSEECFRQCVYCSLDENTGGGIKFFEIEHYKPKSKFEELGEDYNNLFYSCAICNGFKGNDWQDGDTTDMSLAIIPDPSITDYSTIFEVNFKEGNIFGKCPSAIYILNRLYLNRPQLIIYRKYQYTVGQYEFIKASIQNNIDAVISKAEAGVPDAFDLLREIYHILGQTDNFKNNTLDKTRLYSLFEIRK